MNGSMLQWKYVGADDTSWQDLYDLSSLKGADGQAGAAGKDGTCSGYFYAQGNATQTQIRWNETPLPFSVSINNGELIAYDDQGNFTLKQGHVYHVCFNGSIALSADQSNQAFGAALTDNYDNTQSMNSTLIRGNFGKSGSDSDMSLQVPMVYDRIYDASNGEVVLKYILTNYMLTHTTLEMFNYNLTITALN